jgi:hypothetical protein
MLRCDEALRGLERTPRKAIARWALITSKTTVTSSCGSNAVASLFAASWGLVASTITKHYRNLCLWGEVEEWVSRPHLFLHSGWSRRCRAFASLHSDCQARSQPIAPSSVSADPTR